MISERTRRTLVPLVLCVAVLGILVVLTSDLENLDLGPGQPTSRAASSDDSEGPDSRVGVPMDLGFLRHLLFGAFTVSLAIVLISALSARLLRRWLYFTIGLFGAILMFDLFVSKLPSGADALPDEPAAAAVAVSNAAAASSPWTRILAAAGVALAAGAIIVLGSCWLGARWRAFRARRGTPKLSFELEQLAERTLAAGRDSDLVVRCYREMIELLSRREHLPHAALTPREFASRLRDLGLRTAAVDRLTRLFELVRYGHRASDPLADRAVASLDEIRGANAGTDRRPGREPC